MSNAAFGQYAHNLAKQRVLDQQNHDRAILVATIVGLILAIALIFGWVGMSRHNAAGYVTVDRELIQDNKPSTTSKPDLFKPIGPTPFPSGVANQPAQ